MALIKQASVPTTLISVRVPTQVKAELATLRKAAEKNGFDFTATLAAMFEGNLKTIRSELDALDKKSANHANGAAAKEG
jgi:hypothetical protein